VPKALSIKSKPALIQERWQDSPLPAIRAKCREIYERRNELIGELDLNQADYYRQHANAIERFVGNREGRDDARRSARILECAVGAALGIVRAGQRTDRQPSQASEGSGIKDPDDRHRCRLIFKYRRVWEPLLEDRGLTRLQVLTLIKIYRNRETNPPVGSAMIHQADWRNWLAAQPTCDLLLTDPPYATEVADIRAFAHDWLPLALEKVAPTGRAYVCIGAYPNELEAYLTVPRGKLTLAQVLVWTYRNTVGPAPKLDYKQNWQAILYYRGAEAAPLECPLLTELFSVQDINAPDARQSERYHAWQKPDALGERFIRHATKPGDLILDPFAGTGTFLMAAARLGRDAIGCEHDPKQVEVCRERGCLGA